LLPKPHALDWLFFAVGFAVDGVFAMTIILADLVSLEAAILGGGVVLSLRRVAVANYALAAIGQLLLDGRRRLLLELRRNRGLDQPPRAGPKKLRQTTARSGERYCVKAASAASLANLLSS